MTITLLCVCLLAGAEEARYQASLRAVDVAHLPRFPGTFPLPTKETFLQKTADWTAIRKGHPSLNVNMLRNLAGGWSASAQNRLSGKATYFFTCKDGVVSVTVNHKTGELLGVQKH